MTSRFFTVVTLATVLSVQPLMAQERRPDTRAIVNSVIVPEGGLTLGIAPSDPGDEDPFCSYEPATNTCQECSGEAGGCVESTQVSASACFTLCERPSTADSSCDYKPATNACFVTIESGDDVTMVGATTPDGMACEAHCAANGVE